MRSVLQTPLDSDSDFSEIGSELPQESFPENSRNPQFKNQSKMTSLESVVAAVASMHGLPVGSGLSSLYPGKLLGNLASKIRK